MGRLHWGRVVFGICVGVFAFLVGVKAGIADDKEEAKAKFLLGFELVQAENYKDALDAFQGSYDLVPKPSVRFNIGMCQKALFRYVDAIESFERFLKESGADARPDRIQDAKEAIEQLNQLVGRLELKVTPTGASIVVDNRFRGAAPLSNPLRLDPGTHAIKVTKDGYRPFEKGDESSLGTSHSITVILEPVRLVITPNAEPVEETKEAAQDSPLSPERKVSRLLVSGIILSGVGLVSMGIGSYFAVQYNRDHDELLSEYDKYYTVPESDESQQHEDNYYDLKDNVLPKDKTGAIAGFVMGGALLITGTVLIVADAMRRGKERQEVTVAPAPSGITVRF